MYDLCIYNGRVMDPATNYDAMGCVAVKNGIIAFIGPDRPDARESVDAEGNVICPGFIDIHAHEDDITHPDRLSLPRQLSRCAVKTGVTTLITGNCGTSSPSVAAYYQAVSQDDFPVNCYMLVGNVTLRRQVGLGVYDHASENQIKKMTVLCRQAFDDGALGVSFGLQYDPGTTYEEEVALCRIASKNDRLAAFHMRYDYPSKTEETIDEVIRLAKETGVRLQISHLAANVYGENNVSRADRAILAAGADIACDMYPYNVWCTTLQSAVFDEGFIHFNFSEEDLEILTGPLAGQYCTKELFARLRRSPDSIMVACHNAMPIADVEAVYKLPYSMLGSDGSLELTNDNHIKGHPRGSSSPAKFLREFVREKRLFPLMTGLSKLTYLPASRLKLTRKGRLAPGADADITVFNPDTISDRAEFGVDVCATPPTGISLVVIKGQTVYSTR